jgi:hypothetical protein
MRAVRIRQENWVECNVLYRQLRLQLCSMYLQEFGIREDIDVHRILFSFVLVMIGFGKTS